MAESPSDNDPLPTKKIPGIISLNVLRARLQMLGQQRWIAENEDVLKLRLRCVKLFTSPTLNPDTVDALIGWLIEHGFTPDQARHMSLVKVVKELDKSLPESPLADLPATNPTPKHVGEIRRLDEALTAATARLSKELPRSMVATRLEGLPKSAQFASWCLDARQICATAGLQRNEYDSLITSTEEHYRSIHAAITSSMTSEHEEWDRLITATRLIIEELLRLEADICGRMNYRFNTSPNPSLPHDDVSLDAGTITNGQGMANYLDTLATSNTTMRNLVMRLGEKYSGQPHVTIGNYPAANPIHSTTVMIRSRGELSTTHPIELETCSALCWARPVSVTEPMSDPELQQWIVERQHPGNRLRLYRRNENGYYFVLDTNTNQGLFLNELEYHSLRSATGETTPAPTQQAENTGKNTQNPPPPKSKGGRRPLDESNPELAKLYRLIHAISQTHCKRANCVHTMKGNAEIKALAALCRKKVNVELYRAAMKWINSLNATSQNPGQ